MNFYTVVKAAGRQGYTAIGHKIQAYAHNANKYYGVVSNPNKSDVIIFNAGDLIIVLAEEEAVKN
jgi:hypothetical protein